MWVRVACMNIMDDAARWYPSIEKQNPAPGPLLPT
jgi:hypothetical protein